MATNVKEINGVEQEFKPDSWAADPRDLAKEYEQWEADAQGEDPEVQTEPKQWSLDAVRTGRLNPDTGECLDRTPKAQKVAGFVPNSKYRKGFDAIRWDSKPTIGYNLAS